MGVREEATAVIHRSVDGGKESPNWALRTGRLAQALGWQWSLSDTKVFFLDSVCRVASGVGRALEVWTGKFSALMEGDPRYEEGVVQSEVLGGRSVD